MRIAVLTLTRDRLDYTAHCFAELDEFAGCDYDHYVLDQGSTDGTVTWLKEWMYGDGTGPRTALFGVSNIGISRGMNRLLESIDRHSVYDVIVKFDNDCELVQPNTLKDVAALAFNGRSILSPRIEGLRHPPEAQGEFVIGGEPILDVGQIGGIFLAAPAWVYDEFRYDDGAPVWGTDDAAICQWFRQKGGTVGYVKRLVANHYETTDGQWARYPSYFARKVSEGLPG